ncbi:MAG: Crp/Fnr family transcriptional regulator [Peptococcaceae bacterium]|nr:Crp/Fnr family transcriptional regulator [Peptococcaceae bacterium]
MKLIEMPGVRFTKMKKGTIFIKQGETADHIFYLTSGYFYRIMTTVKGEEVIYSVKSASEEMAKCLIGVFSLYGGDSSRSHQGRPSTTDFVAMTDCEGYLIPRAAFFQYIEGDALLANRLLDAMVDEYTRLLRTYQSHQEQGVANRLCQFLLEYSTPNADNTTRQVGVKNVELAGFLGVHRVTVARIIKSLKEEGILARTGNTLTVIDVARLEDYANGDHLEYH